MTDRSNLESKTPRGVLHRLHGVSYDELRNGGVTC